MAWYLLSLSFLSLSVAGPIVQVPQILSTVDFSTDADYVDSFHSVATVVTSSSNHRWARVAISCHLTFHVIWHFMSCHDLSDLSHHSNNSHQIWLCKVIMAFKCSKLLLRTGVCSKSGISSTARTRKVHLSHWPLTTVHHLGLSE